jgi:hypothetical protein
MSRYLSVFGVLIILLTGAFLIRSVILDSAAAVSLAQDPLAASVTASLKGSSYTPILGKDYVIADTSYFEGQQWVVVSIEPVGTSSDAAKLVLKKDNTTYKNILGPSNFFQASDFSALPASVTNFLKEAVN